MLIGPLGHYLRDTDSRPALSDHVTSLLAFGRVVTGVGLEGRLWADQASDLRRALLLRLRSATQRGRLSDARPEPGPGREPYTTGRSAIRRG